MNSIRFLMIGGFLGAGKTTAIARLARHYTTQDQRVGLVTNDQAYNLVDTHLLRSQGFDVGEVAGACFCCKFDDLVETAKSLSHQQIPDLIIAEPVGSCTDLAATVIEPMRHLYQDRFQIAPLVALLKPEHGRKILKREAKGGFSPKAAYIFLKQIEEADIIAINKVDKLTDPQRQELVDLLAEHYPQKQVICVSARSGEGFDQLIQSIEMPAGPSCALQIDYDTYAEGEAELGWLNCQVNAVSQNQQSFSLDQLVVRIVQQLHDRFLAHQVEPGHLKIMGQNGEETAVANLVASEAEVELSLESGARVVDAELILNARVATAPEQLQQLVELVLQQLSTDMQIELTVRGVQSFRPGRPTPTHRMPTSAT